MKHIYFSIFAYMLVATYCQAVSFTFNGLNYSVVSSTSRTCAVISGDSYSGDIVIPSLASYSGDEYKVIRVNDGAFRNCTKVNSVTIPESVTLVEHGAFDGCTSMSQLILKDGEEILSMDGVTTNGGTSCTFSDCPLESIYIGRNLTYRTADNYTYSDPIYSPFAQIMTLRSVYISDAVTNIPHSLFYHCEGLESVEGMKNVQSIDDPARATSYGVFQGCKSLKSFIIPDNITYVGDYAFADCTGLENMIVGNGISGLGQELINNKWIYYGGKYVFDNCKIENLYIGNNFTSIGKYSFEKASIKNLYMFTENPNSIVASVIPTSFNIYVVDTGKYSTLLKGYNVKELFTFNKTSTEYNGSIPQLSYNNEAKDMNISFVDSSLERNVGSYTSNVGVKFSYNVWNTIVSFPCTYTITKAPMTITANSLSIQYGEDIPNLSCTYTGFKNGEAALTALSSLPTLSTNAKKDSDAGAYRIYASGADAKNYSISYQEGTLTIKKAKQSITWNQSFGTNNYADTQIELSAVSSCGLPIEYSTSNQSVAFVSHDNGKYILHLLKEGTVLVTASQSGTNNYEPAESISKAVKVVARLATGITLDKSNETLKIGETITLKATVTPSSIENKEVVWKSSDESVATVSNGVVKGVKEGIATITASTCDGSNLSASCIINVNPILATSISLNKNNASILVGSTLQLTANVSPQNVTNGAVNWSSSDTEIAVVDDGLITALKPGSVVITATTSDGTNLTATCSLTITSIVATSISMDKATATLKAGETVQLVVTIKPDNVENKEVTWISSDKSIATVNDGLVTAISYGTATITAITTDGTNLTASCVVSVESIPVVSLSLDKESVSLFVEEQTVLNASVYPENVGNNVVSWSSSDGNVAVVDNGKVTAKNEGKAIITAKSTDGSNISASCNVTVSRHQQEIIWNQDLSSIALGGELIKLTAESSSGLPVTYTSSDDNVASIFDLGETIYLNPNNCGKAQVTVTQKGNYYYAPAEMSKDVQVVNLDGIEEILNDNNVISVYSINGLKIGTYSNGECPRLPSGVYIVNGKKVCIK